MITTSSLHKSDRISSRCRTAMWARRPYSMALFPMEVILVSLALISFDNFILTVATSNNQPESMVSIRGLSIHHRLIMHGPSHDPRNRFPLLRSRPPQVRSLHDLGCSWRNIRRHIPVVFLGLQPSILRYWNLWLYR